MSIERYGENGEIIYAAEAGPLKNLWKYMAIINEKEEAVERVVERSTFDYNEFFKRLYLSRAELDVTNSVLQLLLKEGDGNILLEAIQHENNGEDNKEKITTNTCLGLKMEFLKEISKDLRASSDSLSENRREEHEIVSGVLLGLREKFRWNLVRILSAEQVQFTLDSVPIIGIDYSPLALFKDSCFKNGKDSSLQKAGEHQQNQQPQPQSQPQYNYNLHIGSENLALVLRGGESGDLSLLFQSKHLEKSVIFSVKNLKTGSKNSTILFQKFNQILNNSNLSIWNEVLGKARNQSICLNIMKLLSQEASKYPQDRVSYDEQSFLKIIIENNFEISMTFTSEDACEDVNDDGISVDVYKKLLFNYLSSSGRELKWDTIRREELENIK